MADKSKFDKWLDTAKPGDEYLPTAEEKTEVNKAVNSSKVTRGQRKTVVRFVVKLK